MRVEFLKTERVGCNECAGIVIFGLFYASLRLDVLLCISPGSVWFAAANADHFADCGVWIVFGSFSAVVAGFLADAVGAFHLAVGTVRHDVGTWVYCTGA